MPSRTSTATASTRSSPAIGAEGTSLYGYSAESSDGAQWSKHIIDDSGIAAQRCEAVDIDGDGDLDLIASGGSTHNVKWYENRSN